MCGGGGWGGGEGGAWRPDAHCIVEPGSDSEASLCSRHHGDLLVMDGRCQDEYLHCASPGLEDKRVNISYRWIGSHTFGCPPAVGVLRSVPTCAQGSPILGAAGRVGPAGVPCDPGVRVAVRAFKPRTMGHKWRVLVPIR